MRSDEEYQKEILLLKSSHKVVKNMKDKVNETVIVKTIENLKNFQNQFPTSSSSELNEQIDEICSRWINTPKKHFKKKAIKDLGNILKEIERMYVIVCENRKSEYNAPYEVLE